MTKLRAVARFLLPMIGWALILAGIWPWIASDVGDASTADDPFAYERWGALAVGVLAVASSYYLTLRDARRADRAEDRKMQGHRRGMNHRY